MFYITDLALIFIFASLTLVPVHYLPRQGIYGMHTSLVSPERINLKILYINSMLYKYFYFKNSINIAVFSPF